MKWPDPYWRCPANLVSMAVTAGLVAAAFIWMLV